MKGEAMLRIAFLVVYFTHLIFSGNLQPKAGGGLDPLGHSTPTPPPPVENAGGGLDPLG
jgi:hypothetical protein